MSNLYYNLYCDESGTNGGGCFYLGAIHCTPSRATILEKQIQALREESTFSYECKWQHVSKQTLSFYLRLVDIFLNDPYATFTLGEMSKGLYWRNLGSTENARFLQAYFAFLGEAMLPFVRYAIYVDEKSIKRYRWDSLRYVLNYPNIRSKTQKKVYRLQEIQSNTHNLIQLVDVLLGGLTTTKATAPHKIELSSRVKSGMAGVTRSGHLRLSRFQWISPEQRCFRARI